MNRIHEANRRLWKRKCQRPLPAPAQHLPAPRPGPRPVFECGHAVDQHVDHAPGSEIGRGDRAPFAEGLAVEHR